MGSSEADRRISGLERQLRALAAKVMGAAAPLAAGLTLDETSEARVEREARRAELVASLEKNRAAHAEAGERARKALAAAEQTAASTRDAYHRALAASAAAARDVENVNRPFDRERDELERELAKLADPRITAFVEDAAAECRRLVAPHGIRGREAVRDEVVEEVDARFMASFFGKRTVFTNKQARDARFDGLSRLIVEAKRVTLTGADVDAELARLRKDLQALPDAATLERVA